MGKKRYIFLDIDGVLWTDTWCKFAYRLKVKSVSPDYFDPRAVALFDETCYILKPKVVMVSTRKHGSSVEALIEDLHIQGCSFELFDKTEDIHDRKREITEYCEKHDIKDDEYVVIDDESYYYEHKNNIVQTQPSYGYTIHEMTQVLDKFGIFKDARDAYFEKKKAKEQEGKS
jgi:hypothetical protein